MNRKKDGHSKWKPTVLEMEEDVFGYKTAKKKKDLTSAKVEKKIEKKEPEPIKQDPANSSYSQYKNMSPMRMIKRKAI